MTSTSTRPPAAARSSERPPRARLLAVLAGVAGGGLTVGIADLVAAALSQQTTPLVAVGAVVVRQTPAWLKDFAVERFGTNDKLVLLVSIGVVVTALSALAGLLGLRRPRAALALVVLLDAVALVATLSRPDAGRWAAVPVVIGALAGLAAFGYLLRALVPSRRRVGAAAPPGTAATAPRPSRRGILAGVLAGGVGAAATQVGAQALQGRRSGLDPAAVRLPVATRPAPALPTGTQLEVAGLTPFVTQNRDFYRIDTSLVVPRIDASTWSLRVHGMVEREISLSYADLLALPLVERLVTLTCVSNEVGGTLAGNATWLGYPLEALLAKANPSPGADMVLSSSADGFTVSTPLTALTDGRDSLLAVGMNGAPLPAEHGFPARMVVPGLYGYVSATKWVVDLEVTRFDRSQAYWTQRGYSAQAPIRTASRIDVPKPFARIPAGPAAVAGVAWAQRRGIAAVQVRVDGGSWQDARLAGGAQAETALKDMWRQWVWEWDAPPGLHLLEVRATDGDGAVQPQPRRRPAPDGATGWHSVSVTVT